MGRKASLRRTTETRLPKQTILVFTEGEVTEPAYIQALKRLEHVRRSTSIRIEIADDHAVPYPLVERAVREASDAEVDAVWCLLDVEAPQRHPRLADAIALAGKHEKVHLAFSNPCFEVWVVLHEKDLGAWASTDDVVSAAQSVNGVSGKHVEATELIQRRALAAGRAVSLRERHRKNGSEFPDDNPSTQVDLFLAAVERSV